VGVIPAVVLETSAAIAYLNGEAAWEEIERLLRLAAGKKISVLMSDFAWREIKPHPAHDTLRLERLRSVADPLPKVARVGECVPRLPSCSSALRAPSAVLPLSHREQALRLADALQLVLAAVIEGDSRRGTGQAPHGVRHQHLSRD